MCFICFVGLCLWICCVSCVTSRLDIVALPGTLSRVELPYGTSLSKWKKPWKRAPEVTSGSFLLGGMQVAMGGTQAAAGRMQVATGGTWVGP